MLNYLSRYGLCAAFLASGVALGMSKAQADVLTDIAKAVATYPQGNVKLDITNLVPSPPGTAPDVNENEVWEFRITFRNNGVLNMTDVRFLIQGRNGACVSLSQIRTPTILVGVDCATPNNHVGTPATYTLGAGGAGTTFAKFWFKAPAGTRPPNTPLVSAHILAFDANWDHILKNLTSETLLPEAVLARQVFPD
jgi:hypothetical protein